MKYNITVYDEQNKKAFDYGSTFKTEEILSHSLLDIIISHLPKGWYLVITPVVIVLLALIIK